MNIVENINTVINNMYQAIEKEIFPLLDDMVIIRTNILEAEPIKHMLKTENISQGLSIIVCFLILGMLLFAVQAIMKMYSEEICNINTKQILKYLVCTILASCAYYICYTILNINEQLTDIVLSISNDLTKKEVSFEAIKQIVSSADTSVSFFSVNGLIKGLVSFGAVSLALNYAIRYVSIMLLVIVSPIFFMLLSNSYTINVFKNWLRLFISNLVIQLAIIPVLAFPLSIKNVDSNLYKIVLAGSIYLLYKLNQNVKELFSQIG